METHSHSTQNSLGIDVPSKSGKLLLIEDNQGDQILFQEILKKTQIKISDLLIADKIQSGLEVLKSENIDIVLLDMSLPDSLGLEGLKLIKDHFKKVPVIILTGMDNNEMALEAIKIGAEDYLVKGTYSKQQLEKSIYYAYERNKNKELVRRNKVYFQTLSENSSDLTLLLDKEGSIMYSTPISSDIIGISPEDLKNKRLIDFAEEKDQQKISEILDLFEAGLDEKVHLEFSVVNQNNNENRTLSATFNPMLNDKIMRGVIVNAHDVSYIKKAESELTQKHLQALKYHSLLLSSQLNPHFIFNSLTSIQFYVLNNDPGPAINFLSEFSKLMRMVLRNSKHQYIYLEEELEFLELYLSIEKRRTPNRFEFDLKVDQQLSVQDTLIPPMLLQPFIENTIIHGFQGLQRSGKLEISFTIAKNQLICKVSDDGVGRQKSHELNQLKKDSKHQSESTTISNKRINILNEIDKGGYEAEIIDKLDEHNESSGTDVILKIPLITE